MNVSHTRHQRIVCASTVRKALLVVGVIGWLCGVGLSATGQIWPDCSDGQCVAGDLVVNSMSIDAQPCSGATRSGILKAELFASSTRYNIRVAAQVYVTGDGSSGYLKTVDYCWPGAFTGTHTITLDSNISWDCSASLELRYTLVSWQVQSDSYPCTSALPCSEIAPKCNGDYYNLRIAVTGSEPENSVPVGVNSLVITQEDVTYTFGVGDFGYADSDGDPLGQIRITSLESVGNLLFGGADVALGQVITAGELAGGQLAYVPLPGQSGTAYDSFRFLVHDGTTYSASDAAMTVHVELVNDSPVAVADIGTVNENESVDLDVLGNDTDPDGDPLSLVSVSDPARGTAGIVGSIIRYTPDPFFYDFDSFTYVIEDPSGAEASASVSVHVVHPNTPPVANAGGSYEGDTRTPIVLDGRFSIDPDVSDLLEYRWDVQGDGTWDTDWLRSTSHTHLYERPFLGRAILEVRDIYRGSPLGTSDQDDAYVRILPAPTELAVSIFVDLDGNGAFDAEDVGLGGVEVIVDGRTVLVTEDDGTALVRGIEPGEHTVELTEGGRTYLQDRGFFISPDAAQSFSIASGEWLALLFHPEVRGFLELEMQGERESP